MRYAIIFFLILFFGNTDNKSKKNQQRKSVYAVILQEINEIDTSKYFITYKIKDGYPIKKYVCEILYSQGLIEKDTGCLKDKILKYNCLLTPEILKIIKCSKKGSANKMEIKYIFSAPFSLDENTILILNSVQYKPTENIIKGGVERAFIFKKDSTDWKLKNKIGIEET